MLPRIDGRNARLLKIPCVSRHDDQPVMQRRCCDQKIRLRIVVSRFSTLLNQQAPLEQDLFIDQQNAFRKHRSDFLSEPIA